MAQLEPMNGDNIGSDFDDKENSSQNSNVFYKTSSTEKVYDEMDISELSMKLRYSITPASSPMPMSRSYTANCSYKSDSGPNSMNNTVVIDNPTLTRSLNSTITKNDVIKSPKLPLQALRTEQFNNSENSSLMRRSFNMDNNMTITITGSDNDDNLSLPSTSSSAVQTPEATTPTAEIPKSDGSSPIMRGLKSVLNMFRSSQSPIPPVENITSNEGYTETQIKDDVQPKPALASTPLASSKKPDNVSKRNSPLKDSVVFNDGLERELQWKDETAIYFKDEKIPIHKLFFQSDPLNTNKILSEETNNENKLSTTVEYMDTSYLDLSSKSADKTMTDINTNIVGNNEVNCIESDSEFVDCESTYPKNASYVLKTVDESGKSLPIVVQTYKIPHEKSYEDYIENRSYSNNGVEAALKFEEGNKAHVNIETDNMTSVQAIKPDDFNLQPTCSESITTNTESCSTLLKDSYNKSLLNDMESHYMPYDISVENHVFQNFTDTGSLQRCVENCTKPTDVTNNISNLDKLTEESAEDNKILKIMSETDHVASFETMNDLNKDCTNADVPTNIEEINLSENVMIPNIFMNSDVKENNTNDFINKTDNLSFNPKSLYNCEIGTISNNKDDLEFIKLTENTDLNSLKTSETVLSETCVPLNAEVNKEFTNSADTTVLKKPEYVNDIPTIYDEKLPSSSIVEETEVVLCGNVLSSLSSDDSILIKNEDAMNSPCNITTAQLELVQRIHNNLEDAIDDAMSIDNGDITNENNYDSKDQIHIKLETDKFENIGNINNKTFELINKVQDSSLKINETNKNFEPKYDSNTTVDILSNKIPECSMDALKNDLGTTFNSEYKTESHDSERNDNVATINEKVELFLPIKVRKELPSDIPLPNDIDIEKYSSLEDSSDKNIEDKDACINEMPDLNPQTTCTLANKQSDYKNNEPVDQSITLKASHILTEKNINLSSNDSINHKLESENCIQELSSPKVSSEKPVMSNNIVSQAMINTKIRESCSLNQDILTNLEIDEKSLNIETKETMLPDVVQSSSESPEKDKSSSHKSVAIIANKTHSFDDSSEAKANDEIAAPGNNCLYIPIPTLDLNLLSNAHIHQSIEVENPFEAKNKIPNTPPSSPKSVKKGYTINFEEIDNPFATKTNLRMSPPPTEALLNQSFTSGNNNDQSASQSQSRRKSNVSSKKPALLKKRTNCTDRVKRINSSIAKTDNLIDSSITVDPSSFALNFEDLQVDHIVSKKSEIENSCNFYRSSDAELKTVSPNEKTILAVQNLDNSNLQSKNVFNLPEINCRSFETKSPPPTEDKSSLYFGQNIKIPTDILDGTPNHTDIEEAALCIADNAHEMDLSNEIYSKDTDDRDITMQEVHTEDEDTIEGPFFEADIVENDMVQFEDLPITSNKEDVEKDEIFIDAEAFEFLLNQNKTNVVADSGKESLFLKFDPLFAKRVSSDAILGTLSSIQKKQSTPKKNINKPLENVECVEEPKPGCSDIAYEEINVEIGNVISKPMMVVNPAVNSIVTQRKSATPKINRHSLTITSPAMVVIDRLLSLSGSTSLLDQDDTIIHAGRNHDADITLTQLRELLADKEINVHNLKCESKELKERLNTLESQVKNLVSESEERLKNIDDLNEQLAMKSKVNKSMANVVEEYERSIAYLIAEIEQERKLREEERLRLINERDEQTAHLASMEGSFSDLHSKFEKSKQIIFGMKANEEYCKKSFKEFDEKLLKMQNSYDSLKQHATLKLNQANQELDKINKAHEVEVLKLTAMMKRKDLHITSLEESLAQKIKANEELTAICDELINKVG